MIKNPIIHSVFLKNNDRYNVLKAVEELNELSTVLMQYHLKSGEHKPNKQEVIDEIGDVEIRLEILKEIFGRERVDMRVQNKLNKFKAYLDGDVYSVI